jgi:hypothetical protein
MQLHQGNLHVLARIRQPHTGCMRWPLDVRVHASHMLNELHRCRARGLRCATREQGQLLGNRAACTTASSLCAMVTWVAINSIAHCVDAMPVGVLDIVVGCACQHHNRHSVSGTWCIWEWAVLAEAELAERLMMRRACLLQRWRLIWPSAQRLLCRHLLGLIRVLLQ